MGILIDTHTYTHTHTHTHTHIPCVRRGVDVEGLVSNQLFQLPPRLTCLLVPTVREGHLCVRVCVCVCVCLNVCVFTCVCVCVYVHTFQSGVVT
jgi:hypothetical protein